MPHTIQFIATVLSGAMTLSLITYGVWFVLSFGEERHNYMPPLWWGQYKTFFPGDMFLWVSVGYGAALNRYHDLTSPPWLPAWSGIIIGFVVGVVLFFVQFSAEEKADPDAIWIWVAPTRVWHQFFIWWIGITLVVSLVVPVLTALVSGDLRTPSTGLTLAFLVVYLLHLLYDAVHPPLKEPNKPVHAPLGREYRSAVLERFLRGIYPH